MSYSEIIAEVISW